MSATAQPAASTPPRILIRSFWMLHRAIVRVTRGRIGLSRPQAGRRFGMMGLTTIGRRSGRRRMAMIGYYEDGPNLVTLAMNGWADADPAWWRNLQAHPETVVTTSSGRRDVVARAAAGKERDRLWAQFRDYPGWGEDIDALAARRPAQTAVVVFEPRRAPDATVVGSGQEEGAADSGASLGLGRPVNHIEQNRRRGMIQPKPRHLWLVPGLTIAVYANGVSSQHGLGVLPLLAFGIMPHLPVLIGLGQPRLARKLAPGTVPLFNVLHHPAPPVAIAAMGAIGILPPLALVAGLAWLSHILVDRALGDGMRTTGADVREAQLVAVRSQAR